MTNFSTYIIVKEQNELVFHKRTTIEKHSQKEVPQTRGLEVLHTKSVKSVWNHYYPGMNDKVKIFLVMCCRTITQ